MGNVRESRWIHRLQSASDPDARLIAFPHAGGSASYFFPLAQALRQAGQPLALDVMAVQYPGRQERRREPCIDDLPTLADAVCREILLFADRPLILFGHSMGSWVAFEVTRRLEQKHGITPLALFASGRRAPSITRQENIHQLPDSGIVKEIALLDGTDSVLLSDPEILQMALPAIRGDYKAIETYAFHPGPRLQCPIHAVLGEADPRVSVDDARGWAKHTSGGFELSMAHGSHFYLKDQQDFLAGKIVDRLTTLSAERTRHG
ncbi:thioesterase II family protein [Streptomyces sp. ME19-01-6]|uniref:thioesterase II family protein n=1 Tax=Streptomyces sp. ME19-01-6 TaxID=3028686 RepID=UPI0029A27A68|nr:alpha/beta fold hydrolase [Streptomyces sp. ME19-01-6]MDX3230472.1 alpha/beta fold hydrolase [Streptomyces sp. ME19-01-6]